MDVIDNYLVFEQDFRGLNICNCYFIYDFIFKMLFFVIVIVIRNIYENYNEIGLEIKE